MIGGAPRNRLEGEWIPMCPNARCSGPTHPAVPDHLIVVRDDAEWCQALREAIAARGNFTLVVDGRYAERRRRVQPVREERRQGDRRNCSAVTADTHR